MASVKTSIQDRRPAPDLNISLASNNPFRAAATSPSHLTPPVLSTTDQTQQSATSKRISTNPFLDDADMENPQPSSQMPRSPPKPMPPPGARPPPRKPVAKGEAAELLAGMTLSEQPTSDRNLPQRVPQPNGHRPGRSAEEDKYTRSDRPKPNGNGSNALDVFADPSERENRKPSHGRRNSETSVIDVKDEEKKRQERRYRERDPKDPKSRTRRPPDPRYFKPKKKNEQLDIIDKLDVTSIFGMGLFHHDGPFDACNPHRNRKGLSGAPMQAFPEGSSNNALGGAVPTRMDYDKFHGRGAEGFSDYSRAPQLPPGNGRPSEERGYSQQKRPVPRREESFDPKAHEAIHGPESFGLGTSTFLEGTPVPRQVLQRRESETVDDNGLGGPGLSRKKSISQKLKTMSSRRRAPTGESGKIMSPEPRYELNGRPLTPRSPPPATQSAGGRAQLGKPAEINPFFNNPYNANETSKNNVDVKTESTEIEERDVSTELQRPRTATSPKRGLAKKTTNDSDIGTDGESKPSGLLQRVKSLKGGKRSRPDRDRSGSDPAAAVAPTTAPGTAM